MSELDLDRAIRGYIKLALNDIPVIPANSNFPAPTTSYATALQLSDLRQGFSFNNVVYNSDNDKNEISTSSNRLITYSIQIYRDTNVLGLARQLSFFGSTPNGQYYLDVNNLSLIDWSDIRNLTTVVDGEMEPRASIDITFGQVVTLTQETDRIIEINIDSWVDDSIQDNQQII